MLSVQRVYLDGSGGGRVFIPAELMANLGWKNHERLVMIQDDGHLALVKEEEFQKEVHA